MSAPSTISNVGNKTLTLRVVFIGCMVAGAILCSVLGHRITKNLEVNIAIQTYESITSGALEEAQAITMRKQYGADVLSTVLGYAFPSANQWPFVGLRGYTEIANKVSKLSMSVGHGFMVVVRPEEVVEFEAHAARLYEELKYPEKAGVSEFGFGIYAKSPTSEYSDGRIHDGSGNTTWGSERNFAAPFVQHMNTFKNPNLLMMNLHAEEFRGRVLDSIMSCAEAADPSSTESPACGVVTDFTEIFVLPGPAAVFFYPIFPADDPTTVVGFIGASINWKEVLTNVVPDYVDGIDCVVSQGTKSFTYTIVAGVPELVGEGDLHDPAYSEYGHTAILNAGTTGASASMSYTLTMYPTETMFKEFRTSNPIFVGVGFAAVILVCAAVFFLYDYFMQYQSTQRKKILEVKRRFVRFISHEIRTPLNVVCMGLELLQFELGDKVFQEAGSGQTMTPEHMKQHENSTTTAVDSSVREKEDDETNSETASASYCLGLTGDILENAQNAVSVLNDLLNYDKIESGTFKIEVGNVDIWSLVKKTVSEFTIQSRNRNVSLDVEMQYTDPKTLKESSLKANGGGDVEKANDCVDPKKLRVLGDDIRLTQVIRNLISNALKFTPESGNISVIALYDPDGLPDAKLELPGQDKFDAANQERTCRRAGSIRISIKDSGVGLSKEQLGSLFGEGVQFDANKLQSGGGSGLGLCITKEIVEQHNGTIVAKSDGFGQGTTFILELPLQESAEMEETETITSSCTSEAVQSKHHILVVDDVILNTKMLVRLLNRQGHTCEVAHNGKDAIQMYTANMESGPVPFDTILMDYEMPEMKGPEAAKILREMGCKALILGLTGNVLAEDVAFFKSHGADQVLAKPVQLSSISTCWSDFERQQKN